MSGRPINANAANLDLEKKCAEGNFPANICTSWQNVRANICTRNEFYAKEGLGVSELSRGARDFINHSLSESTKRSYGLDLADYAALGYIIPSAPEALANYLSEAAGRYAVATVQRRLAAISKAHQAMGVENPARSELVRSTMKGIRRTHGVAQRQAKALLRDDLFHVLDAFGDRPIDIRDRALLLLGFTTAMRRSELVALDVADIEPNAKGVLVNIRRSKTDQEGAGRKVAVPVGRTRHCPVTALRRWLETAGIADGAIFRSINKAGRMYAERLSGEAVSHIVKVRLAAVGYDPTLFSGHSLRAGFATSAAQAGASSWKIQQVTGHKSQVSLARYIRDVDLFDDAAAFRLV